MVINFLSQKISCFKCNGNVLITVSEICRSYSISWICINVHNDSTFRYDFICRCQLMCNISLSWKNSWQNFKFHRFVKSSLFFYFWTHAEVSFIWKKHFWLVGYWHFLLIFWSWFSMKKTKWHLTGNTYYAHETLPNVSSIFPQITFQTTFFPSRTSVSRNHGYCSPAIKACILWQTAK